MLTNEKNNKIEIVKIMKKKQYEINCYENSINEKKNMIMKLNMLYKMIFNHNVTPNPKNVM